MNAGQRWALEKELRKCRKGLDDVSAGPREDALVARIKEIKELLEPGWNSRRLAAQDKWMGMA